MPVLAFALAEKCFHISNMEVCVTLGELGPEEAGRLKEAGVTAYNHNIDTSPEHYSKIVTTHTFEDRLRTIRNVQDAGMSVCSGGILGLGESVEDRLHMRLNGASAGVLP